MGLLDDLSERCHVAGAGPGPAPPEAARGGHHSEPPGAAPAPGGPWEPKEEAAGVRGAWPRAHRRSGARAEAGDWELATPYRRPRHGCGVVVAESVEDPGRHPGALVGVDGSRHRHQTPSMRLPTGPWWHALPALRLGIGARPGPARPTLTYLPTDRQGLRQSLRWGG